MGEARDAVSAFEHWRMSPDAVVVVQLPMLRELQGGTSERPRALAVVGADADVPVALDLGAQGVVANDAGADELALATRTVAAGELYISPGLATRLVTAMRTETATLHPRSATLSLSRSETATLRLIARGLSNREVAGELGVQVKTVKFHMTNILSKLGVRNRVEASIWANREWRDIGQ